MELLVASYALDGVFRAQVEAVPGREFGGDRVSGLGSRQETTNLGSKGIRLVALKPASILFAVIEA